MSEQLNVAWVKEEWLRVAGNYSADKLLIQQLFEEIRKAYSQKNRYYHNLRHIHFLLSLSEKYRRQLGEKDIIDFSIFYHDIVYNVLMSDNEDKSAQVAGLGMQQLKVPGNKIELVKKFIDATKHHESGGGNNIELAFFLDFDMCILGAPWEVYSEYSIQVRKEHSIYPDILYKRGRWKFLQACLDSPSIFHTNEFIDAYESQARLNITRELEML